MRELNDVSGGLTERFHVCYYLYVTKTVINDGALTMRIANYILFCANIIVLATAGWFVISRGYSLQPDPNWKFSEIVSLLFATSTIVMAALTIVLAVLAVLGYSAIQKLAKESAEAVAEKVARETAEPAASRAAQDILAQAGAIQYQTDDLTSALSGKE